MKQNGRQFSHLVVVTDGAGLLVLGDGGAGDEGLGGGLGLGLLLLLRPVLVVAGVGVVKISGETRSLMSTWEMLVLEQMPGLDI